MARVAASQSRQVAGGAADEAGGLASTAAERGGDLVRVAKEDARQLAGTVRARAGEVTEQLTSQSRSLVEETKGQLEGQVRTGTQRAAGGFRQLGEQVQALAEGRPEDAPALTDYVWRAADGCYGVADKLHGLGDDIETRGFAGVLGDLQSFARRRPGTFLLGALAVGFSVGRMVKAESEADDTEEDDAVQPAIPARTRAVR
ncbi:MAG: hypothetical protein ABR540_10535 [Acidimicrobiales bacterium]